MSEEKAHRGFRSMDPAKQREIASKGGRTAHERGVAHQWDKESASAAGRKGGRRSAEARKARETAAAAR